jgi:hypothetical protein
MAELLREKLREELEKVREASPDRKLHAEKAVEWAKTHRRSTLAGLLEWDQAKAADAYRVEQVRHIIRVVVITPPEMPRTVRAYVSMASDRTHGGGYRPTAEALARGRQELVNEALMVLRRLRDRFTHLPELDPLFTNVARLVDEYEGTSRPRLA